MVQVWHVYLLMFVRATAGGFHWPAMQASTTLMVPPEQLTRVQGLNQTLQGALNIASAPLGALLLEVLPMQGILGIDVVTALFAVVPLFFIFIPQPQKSQETSAATPAKASVWQDFRAGLRYVWAWPGLVMIMLMATIVNLVLNPAFSLLPILVTKHFEGGALQLSWLESAFGMGVLCGSLILSAWGGFKRRIVTSLVGLIGMGLSTLLVGLTPASSLWLAVGGALFIGIMMPITNGPIMAVMQVSVSPEMQGRVFTLVSSVAAAMSPLGLIVAGPVADTFGVRVWFIAGGVVATSMGLCSLFVPAVLNMEDRNASDNSTQASLDAVVGAPAGERAAVGAAD